MNDINKMRDEARNSLAAIFVKFILSSSQDGQKKIFCFIEGRDAPYYYPRIKNRTDLDIIPITCNGKRNVIKIHEKLSNKLYDKYLKLYFVDRDFDDNDRLSDDIFVTPCYSIENLYVSQNVLEEIIKCEFNITPTDQSYFRIIKLFNDEFTIFNKCVLLFNAFYLYMKKNYTDININLDEKLPRELFTIRIGNISSSCSLEAIKDKYLCDKLDEIALNCYIEILASDYTLLRGKFQKQFFIEFLKFLIEDANTPSKRNYINHKTSFTINSQQFISQLSQYAQTPTELTIYLSKMLN